MRTITLCVFMCVFFFNALSQESSVWTNKKRVLPDALRKLPVAINIYHTPNPNYPELAHDSDRTKYKYVWRHATSMISTVNELKVIKAGSFIWYNNDGWKENVKYNRKDFEKKFNCKKGILMKDEKYTFIKNY